MRTLDLSNLNIEMTKRLNEIANAHKKGYTEFVDYYCKQNEGKEYWWATPFASRNISIDNTFFQICLYLLCVEVMKDAKELKEIFVESSSLKDALEKQVNEENYRIKIRLINYHKEKPLFVRFSYEFVADFIRWLLIKKTIKDNGIEGKKENIWIDIDTMSSCFVNNQYMDRDYTGIQKYASEEIIFFPTLIRNTKVTMSDFVKKVQKNVNYKFWIKEKELKSKDFASIFRYFLMCKKAARKNYIYQGYDVSEIVRASLIKGSADNNSWLAVKNYCFIRNMKKLGIQINKLVLWYEGRPSDLMLAKSYREQFPEGKCIGYQGFPLSDLNLGLYVSEEQYRQKACCSIIGVPPRIYTNAVTQFCPQIDSREVPILRTNYAYRQKKCEKGKVKLLIILPYFVDIARDMLKIINEYLIRNNQSYSIYIKNHPNNIDYTVEDYVKEKIDMDVQYIKGELIDSLQGMDVVYTTMSASILEIYSQDKPMILFGIKGGFNNNFIPDELTGVNYQLIYDNTMLEHALETIRKSKQEAYKFELLDYLNAGDINALWT